MNIKTTFLLLLLTPLVHMSAAQMYKNKEQGVKLSFFSKTPMKDIAAENNKSSSVWAFSNDSIVFKVPISGFKFQNSLMEEHFNENYLESSKYPYANFRGKVNTSLDPKKTGTYQVTATGWLEIHGVKQLRTIDGKVQILNDGSIILDSNFKVNLVDHKITVPSIVGKEIAEQIDVTLHAEYQLK